MSGKYTLLSSQDPQMAASEALQSEPSQEPRTVDLSQAIRQFQRHLDDFYRISYKLLNKSDKERFDRGQNLFRNYLDEYRAYSRRYSDDFRLLQSLERILQSNKDKFVQKANEYLSRMDLAKMAEDNDNILKTLRDCLRTFGDLERSIEMDSSKQYLKVRKARFMLLGGIAAVLIGAVCIVVPIFIPLGGLMIAPFVVGGACVAGGGVVAFTARRCGGVQLKDLVGSLDMERAFLQQVIYDVNRLYREAEPHQTRVRMLMRFFRKDAVTGLLTSSSPSSASASTNSLTDIDIDTGKELVNELSEMITLANQSFARMDQAVLDATLRGSMIHSPPTSVRPTITSQEGNRPTDVTVIAQLNLHDPSLPQLQSSGQLESSPRINVNVTDSFEPSPRINVTDSCQTVSPLSKSDSAGSSGTDFSTL